MQRKETRLLCGGQSFCLASYISQTHSSYIPFPSRLYVMRASGFTVTRTSSMPSHSLLYLGRITGPPSFILLHPGPYISRVTHTNALPRPLVPVGRSPLSTTTLFPKEISRVAGRFVTNPRAFTYLPYEGAYCTEFLWILCPSWCWVTLVTLVTSAIHNGHRTKPSNALARHPIPRRDPQSILYQRYTANGIIGTARAGSPMIEQ